jgi:two-component system cell cycle response regulator
MNGKVLIVDDQLLNLKLLAAHLEAAGYEVCKASSGEEALRAVPEFTPDIVLLDIMMPGLDGYEVTRRLRGDPATSTIPIVLLTALEGTGEKVQGLDAGADDFLTKPVNRSELLARMRSLIKLKRLQEELKAKTELSPLPRATAPRAPGKRTILLVEDDERTVKHTRLVLENGGYATVVARSGGEAAAVLAASAPDLVLLDLMLPDMNGLELLARIRADAAHAELPVLITSALGDLDTKVKGIDTGADDYLVKPVNPFEMLARIKSNLRKLEASRRLRAELDAAASLAITDPLTGLYNRHHLVTVLEKELAAAQRHRKVFSLLLLDLDHFKSVNDTCGHLVGDAVLKELALLLGKLLRASDTAARFGGEEFLVVLPDTDLPGALVLAERFRQAVADHAFPPLGERRLTVSVGVASSRPEDRAVNDVVGRADEALYRAKTAGRNRVLA